MGWGTRKKCSLNPAEGTKGEECEESVKPRNKGEKEGTVLRHTIKTKLMIKERELAKKQDSHVLG